MKKANNIMKKTIALCTAFVMAAAMLLAAPACSFAQDGAQMEAVSANEVWTATIGGSGYQEFSSPSVYDEGYLYTVAMGKIYKVDASSGESTSKDIPGEILYNTVSPVVSGDKVYIGLDGSKLAIIDKNDLSSEVVSFDSDKVGDNTPQCISKVTVNGDYVYVATCYNASNTCGCLAKINIKTQEVTKLIDSEADSNHGFYWAGMCVSDGYGIIGTNSSGRGWNPDSGEARIYCVNLNDGTKTYAEVEGSVCSTPTEYGGAFYFTTKAGKLYKASVKDGKIEAASVASLGGASTCSPLIYNDKVYIGYSGGVIEYDPEAGATTKLYAPGDVKQLAEYEGNILCTYNKTPGGIYNVTYGYDVFVPQKSQQEYCVSPMIIEGDMLYYKNDSNTHFALKLGALEPFAQTITASSLTKSYGSSAFTLSVKGAHTPLAYSSSSTSVATISQSGKVTIKGTGRTTITISTEGNAVYKPATKKITLTVVPKKTSGFKVSAGSKKMTVKWSKDSKATGYQIVYAKNSKFTSGKKTVTVSSYKYTSKTIKKLSKRKYYYVKMRSYKTVSGTKYYGSYTSAKKIKIK